MPSVKEFCLVSCFITYASQCQKYMIFSHLIFLLIAKFIIFHYLGIKSLHSLNIFKSYDKKYSASKWLLEGPLILDNIIFIKISLYRIKQKQKLLQDTHICVLILYRYFIKILSHIAVRSKIVLFQHITTIGFPVLFNSNVIQFNSKCTI